MLHEKANIQKGDLAKEIEELVTSKQLPSYIASKVDAIRVVGNFAAHPIKSKNTGEIVDVEPAEAEWLLGILESLFDWYFVWLAQEEQKKSSLNLKLQAYGKPPIK